MISMIRASTLWSRTRVGGPSCYTLGRTYVVSADTTRAKYLVECRLGMARFPRISTFGEIFALISSEDVQPVVG